jgi:hypothetical protein
MADAVIEANQGLDLSQDIQPEAEETADKDIEEIAE